jgi:hypothetical protein
MYGASGRASVAEAFLFKEGLGDLTYSSIELTNEGLEQV